MIFFFLSQKQLGILMIIGVMFKIILVISFLDPLLRPFENALHGFVLTNIENEGAVLIF